MEIRVNLHIQRQKRDYFQGNTRVSKLLMRSREFINLWLVSPIIISV
jgi:hypothetical protein